MVKEEIDDIKIEHRSEKRYWNVTMFVVPLRGNSGKVPCYAELVEMAEDVLRKAKGLGREWFPSNAEVMAWSSNHMPDGRGISTPHRYRVTFDMTRNGEWGDSDAD